MINTPGDIMRLPITDNGQAAPVAEIGRATERTKETELANAQYASVGSARSVSSVGSVGSVGSARSVTNIPNDLDDAINSTLPSSVDRWFLSIFGFARALKAMSDVADAELQDLHSIVELWHERAAPVIGAMPFIETWGAFVTAWPRVRYARGCGPMAEVLAKVDESSLSAAAERYDCPKIRRLILICAELQRAAGDAPFFLSCRTAGELIGLDNVAAWRRLKVLVADGIIRTVEVGTKARATRYRYVAPLEVETTS